MFISLRNDGVEKTSFSTCFKGVFSCQNMRHQNAVKFSEELKGIDWENFENKRNAQEAYSVLHKS